jgi:hypothetical protein
VHTLKNVPLDALAGFERMYDTSLFCTLSYHKTTPAWLDV